MTATLLIDPVEKAGWLLREGSAASWRPGQALPPQTTVVAIAPAEAATLHTVSIPARRRAELRQALPYALEEHLAEPVERLHFALGQRDGDRVEAAVVSRAALNGWLQSLADIGLVPSRLYVDAQLLPRRAGRAHLARVGGRLLVATGQGAWALPEAGWNLWRERLADQELLALDGQGRFGALEDLPPALTGTELLRWAHSRLADPGAINLLQDEFAPARDQADRLRLGRWAALLAGLALVLALVDAAVGVRVEQNRRDALRTQMAQVFRQVLPDARMTADPAAQLLAEFGSGAQATSGEFFDLLGRAAPALTQNSRYRLMAVDFRLGLLEIDVSGSDVASLDALRELLAAHGLDVELTGVDPGDDGVRGRMRLRGGRT
ncbi:MAG: type II secretion system protein GspL [Xanthomonadales bacterium]|nr:type II secretion system protein GspL [Xanthomonadales bacterium]